MPELPEVEVVRRSLKDKLVGRKILTCHCYYDGIIEYPTKELFLSTIENKTIKDVKRYGKWLIFVLDDYYLLSHLRMEGKYFFRNPNEQIYPHEHLTFTLDNQTELRYMDVRKFGKMLLIPKDKIKTIGPFTTIGLEPWDKKLNVAYLKEKFQTRKLPIKTLLLDQTIIAGIGNIYANEILFLCGINPLKKGNTLSDEELSLIIKNTQEELEKAIQQGGTTIRSYTSVNGIHGLFQRELLVHGKENQPCSKCQNIIIKTTVGGRGTYYCPNCQK